MAERKSADASLRALFRPTSVAVVGASRDPKSIGQRVLQALVQAGFAGTIYPVNPRARRVCDLPAHPSLDELPEPADLAIVCTPRSTVLQVVDQCGRSGVKAVVVITAGFAEFDASGRELQRELTAKARAYGMRLLGPNCVGLLNTAPDVRLNAIISPLVPPRGRVAIGSQSGALGTLIAASVDRFQLGISSFASLGNAADVSIADLVQYWADDEATDVILLYLESWGDARRFAEVVERVSRRKPVVALKAGLSEAGQRAAGSHTAALASGAAALEAIARRTGIVPAGSLEGMLETATLLANQPLPAARRLAVVTNAGGPAVICADACAAAGLEVPRLSAKTQAELAKFLAPPTTNVNPVDMLASAEPDQYRRVVDTLLVSGEVDALVAIYVPVEMVPQDSFKKSLCDGVARARSRGATHQPVVACVMSQQGGRMELKAGDEIIPCCVAPEVAARVLGQAAAYSDWRRRPPRCAVALAGIDLTRARQICRTAIDERGPGWLSLDETNAVLEAMSLPVAACGVATSGEMAAELAGRLGFPVAMKAASRRVVHKTDVGAVQLDLADERAVREAYQRIGERLAQHDSLAAGAGVLVQPMLGGVEVMVGATRDPSFGPLVVFGLGGIHVEILGDVVYRMTPLSESDAGEMVRAIRGHPLLEGYRGSPGADVSSLCELLCRIARLVNFVAEIRELDLNPVLAHSPGEGCHIVDARIRVQSSGADDDSIRKF